MKIRRRKWSVLWRMYQGAHVHPQQVRPASFPPGITGIFMRGMADLFGCSFVTSKFNFWARKEERLGRLK